MARKPAANPKQGQTKPGPEHRIVVLHGKDAFLRAEYTASLRRALEEARGAVDTLRYEGAAEVADVLDECRSFGLMQQHKLVVVDDADQFVKDSARPLLERYAEHPAEDATLVLRAERWNKGKLDKLIEAVGVIRKCDAPTEGQAAAWAQHRAQVRHGAEIGQDAARALVARVGADLGRIDAELAKLAAAAGKNGKITPELVGEFVGVSREEEVWGMQAALLGATPEAALGHLRELIEVSRQPTVLISYALCDLARKLHLATVGLRAGENPGAIGKTLKLWGPSQDAVMRAARGADPSATMALLDAALEADVAQKTGLGDPERHLERVVLRFAGAV